MESCRSLKTMNERDIVLTSAVSYYCQAVARDLGSTCDYDLMDLAMGQLLDSLIDGDDYKLCHALPLILETRRCNYQFKNRHLLLEYVTGIVRDMAASEDSPVVAGDLSKVHAVLAEELREYVK